MYSIPHHHSQFDFDERDMVIDGKQNNNRSYNLLLFFIIFAREEYQNMFCNY